MAILPGNLARVSTLMQSSFANRSIVGTQNDILRTQQELTTARRLNNLSDNPGDAALAQQLRKQLEQRTAFEKNLNLANRHLNEVDTVLADVTDLLRQAGEVASGAIGAGVTAAERQGAGEVVDSIYRQMLQLANKSWNGMYLFAGDRLTSDPFVEEVTGVKFVGSSRMLTNATDESTELPFQVNPAEIFGAAQQFVGTVDLQPALSPDTRLSDLTGATGQGIRPGVVALSDGVTTVEIDLSDADTVGDVIDRINAAGVGGITASLGTFNLQINAGAGDNVTLREVGGGTSAADLGILRTIGAGAGIGIVGSSTEPRVTGLTRITDLNAGTGIDAANGIAIHNGEASAPINFIGDTTVQQMLNRINTAGLGVHASISDDGTRIQIANQNQGTQLRISEGPGTTATDLGLRTFSTGTALADLNEGRGVATGIGADFTITNTTGVSFAVDISTAASVQDVIDTINAAATFAGANVTATFTSPINGKNSITLTDTAGGAGTMTVTPAFDNTAAADLGLLAEATGNVIYSDDVNPVTADGIFGRLLALKSALLGNDDRGITQAAEGLGTWESNVIAARGSAGARVQEFESRLGRLEEQNIATKTALSELEDADFAASILKFQSLQTTLQASMGAFGQITRVSLMDFLR